MQNGIVSRTRRDRHVNPIGRVGRQGDAAIGGDGNGRDARAGRRSGRAQRDRIGAAWDARSRAERRHDGGRIAGHADHDIQRKKGVGNGPSGEGKGGLIVLGPGKKRSRAPRIGTGHSGGESLRAGRNIVDHDGSGKGVERAKQGANNER